MIRFLLALVNDTDGFEDEGRPHLKIGKRAPVSDDLLEPGE